MHDLIDTTEMYLRTILELEEEGIVPMRARISERLDHSGPTVSQTVARMERDGLVIVSDDRRLKLTQDGRRKAVVVMRKHRLAERLLRDVIGLEWEFVHEEACRWEHVMSDQVERKILDLLADPSESPYGNPIPGLAEFGLRDSDVFADGLVTADSATRAVPVQGVLRRIAEPVQHDPQMLRRLLDAGVVPGAVLSVIRNDNDVTVDVQGIASPVTLPLDVGSHLFLDPDIS
ncbi:MAG: metal-dependent transcriptional regulator [Microbacteriaceae bacterium]|nr:metal-dependent transcriptional regulator [Microbacteriaceae bacterium]